ncbi:30S ribosome-binding factor RbfA [Desulfohalobium retbaense]|uniref:Ribosome-binding factor A n=1 Tax=Desulfohalobium retbaense (strain ATCC 49708 / DSM 5692 / JCM 16813 / HR100) TaxID=485915 RepID=C8X0G5_DESRD|nr:30S ribosome-binding factor RbfA [Desulfohalobium retbaense]ACV67790.1 ribosome-binding factor A [Desulfohalobium retbaense DSM 5692]
MHRGTTRRAQRMGDTIMREIGHLLVEEAKDPRLQLVTISGVRMNRNLQVAEVLFTHPEGRDKEQEIITALESASGFLRTALGKRLRLRFVPQLRFTWDTFLEDMVYEHPTPVGDPDTDPS